MSKTRKNNSNILISVVIVAGPNRLDQLMRCIDSIYKSHYRNFEIVLIDNSNNPLLSKSVLSIFPMVMVVRMPENIGIFSYNIGFINAKGSYILALDDDCKIKPTTLQNIFDCFQKKPKRVAVLCLNVYNPIGRYYYFTHYLAMNLTNVFTFMGGGCVFRKDVFDKVGYYDSDFFLWVHEDDLSARILNAGNEIHFEKDIVIDHYEASTFRRKKVFFIFRNKVWFTIKNFSFRLFPLMFAKDVAWFFSLSNLQKDVQSLFFMILGSLWGYISFPTPLKKRAVIEATLQKKYVEYYVKLFRYLFF